MSFNKWKDEYGLEFEPNYSKETELDCKAAFKAGQQSRQDEIDELKMANHNLSVMVVEAESYSEHWKYERDKLQKRVKELELINFDSELHFDAAKEHIDHLQKKIDLALEKCYTGIRKQGGDYYLELVQDILKGEQTK